MKEPIDAQPALSATMRALTLAALLVLTSCGAAKPAPSVLQGDIRVHDPSLIRQGETYYVFSTGDEYGLNQGNIQIRKSKDLANWELVGTVFPIIPDWIGHALGSTPPNLWAPDISYFNGKYYLYYAGSPLWHKQFGDRPGHQHDARPQ